MALILENNFFRILIFVAFLFKETHSVRHFNDSGVLHLPKIMIKDKLSKNIEFPPTLSAPKKPFFRNS